MSAPAAQRRTAILAIVACVGALLLTLPRPAAAADATVTLTDGAAPRNLEVGIGAMVTFRNADDERHRMRARDPEDIDTSNIEPGASVTVRLPVAGMYRFVDERTDATAYNVTVTVQASEEPDGSSSTPSSHAQPGPSDGAASAPSSATVSIPSRSFSPARVTVAVGGTVTWTNQDGEHTVTARDASFDSGIFDEGGSFRRRFPRAGTFDYFCILHPEMTGQVIVGGAADPSPSSPSTGSGADEVVSRTSPPPIADPAGPDAPDRGDGSADAAPDGAGAAARTLDIVDLAFEPADVTVPVGTEVTWVNRGELPHTVSSNDGGPLDSELLANGDRYRHTFGAPGEYRYLCALHPEMVGTVTVAGDVGAASAPEDEADTGSSARPSTDRTAAGTSSSAAGVDTELTRAATDDDGDLPLVSGIVLTAMAIAFVMGRSRRRT